MLRVGIGTAPEATSVSLWKTRRRALSALQTAWCDGVDRYHRLRDEWKEVVVAATVMPTVLVDLIAAFVFFAPPPPAPSGLACDGNAFHQT